MGVDLRKTRAVLEAAYDDAAGVTARFSLNLLARINRELGGHFELDAFRHRSRWNERARAHRDASQSPSRRRCASTALALDVPFRAGEQIYTESSYKLTDRRVVQMLTRAGFSPETTWSDERRWFGDHLARVRPNASTPA